MPPFVMHLVSVYSLIFLSELDRTRNHLLETNQEHESIADVHLYRELINVVALVLNVYNFIIFSRQSYNLNWQ